MADEDEIVVGKQEEIQEKLEKDIGDLLSTSELQKEIAEESEGSSKEKTEGSTEEEKTGKETGKETGEEEGEEDVSDGTSHAYGLKGDAAKFAKKTPSAKKKKNVGTNMASPPERKKGGGGGGSADNFMDAVWKELIVPFYTGCIDKAVDWTLDFAEWVLYAPFTGGSGVDDIKKEEKKTVFAHADELIEEHNKKADEKMNMFLQAHTELIENINKHLDGKKDIEWTVWENKPDCFDDLCEIAKKAKENPKSEEAKKWKKVLNGPDFVQDRIEKEKIVTKMAIAYAALELSLKKDLGENPKIGIEKEAEKYYNEITSNIEKIRKENKGDPAKAREETGNYLKGLKKNIAEGIDAVNSYKEQGKADKLKEYWSKAIRYMSSFGKNDDKAMTEDEIMDGTEKKEEDKKEEPTDEKVKTTKEKAQEKIKESIENISGYKTESGKALKDLEAEEKPYEDVLGSKKADKTEVMQAINNRLNSLRR